MIPRDATQAVAKLRDTRIGRAQLRPHINQVARSLTLPLRRIEWTATRSVDPLTFTDPHKNHADTFGFTGTCLGWLTKSRGQLFGADDISLDQLTNLREP